MTISLISKRIRIAFCLLDINIFSCYFYHNTGGLFFQNEGKAVKIWCKMGGHKIQISLTKGIIGVIAVLTICVTLAATLVLHAIIGSYTQFIATQTSDFLTLYTGRVETNLNQVKKLCYDILSSNSIQDNLTVYTNSPESYKGYSAYISLYDQIFMMLLEEKYVKCGYLIFNNGNMTTLSVRKNTALPKNFIREASEKAVQAKGRDVWMVGQGDPATLVCAKQINTIADASRAQKAILILNLDLGLLRFDSNNDAYSPILCCRIQDDIICSPDNQLNKTDVAELIRQNGSGIAKLGQSQKKYFYVSRASSVAGWRFSCILCSDSLMGSINSATFLSIVLFLLMTLSAAALLSMLSKLICRPVTKVVKSMNAVQNQKFEKINGGSGRVRVRESVELVRSYNAMIARMDYLINEVYLRQLTISDMRYKILQQQINPHFLYNTLDTIHWEAVANGDEDGATMALNLSRLLRNSIKKPDVVTLREELELLSDYISIQKIRFEERLEFRQEDACDLLEYRIPKMTIQPIVENSIRHNLEKHDAICRIRISYVRREKDFSIVVHDNGAHTDRDHIRRVISGQETTQGRGIGLKNIQERLRICFGEPYGLNVPDASDGTSIEITLPYCLDEKDDLNFFGHFKSEIGDSGGMQ